jgi:hypothetical protein
MGEVLAFPPATRQLILGVLLRRKDPGLLEKISYINVQHQEDAELAVTLLHLNFMELLPLPVPFTEVN